MLELLDVNPRGKQIKVFKRDLTELLANFPTSLRWLGKEIHCA